jgi:hypothetical protein
MAESLDVSARLAEGRPAVDNIGDYVWACHLLGYQNADLTLHPAQVRDWYSSEDGLDLRALDADLAALDAAASAAEGARQLQERQLGALSGAWQGRGGDATHEFLVRHGGASSAAASAVRDAVDALTALRDELWRTVDEKVGTAVAIDDRRQAERAQWLAATQTVTTGAGDRAEASELINQQVKPFVDNDIRSDWVAAMQKAMAAIAAAFDAATGALTTEPSATFDVPGDLGPLPPPGSASTVETAGTAPAGWPSLPSAGTPAVSPMTAPASPLPAAQDPVAASMPTAAMPAPVPAAAPAGATAPAMPTMPSLGDLGGGLTGGAGGLAGLGQQIADAIGGLLDQPDDALPDSPDVKDDSAGDLPSPSPDQEDHAAADDKPDESDEKPDDPDEKSNDLPAAETDDAGSVDDDACTDVTAEETPSRDEPVSTAPAPVPPPPQPIVEPPPAPEPVGAETPCEIAADELPQAGP